MVVDTSAPLRPYMSSVLSNTTKPYVETLTIFYVLVKGMAGSILILGSFPYFYYFFDVSGIEYQINVTIILLPWGCKSCIGILTDMCPIRGYHKRWYAYISAVTLPLWIFCAFISTYSGLFTFFMCGASTCMMTLDALMESQFMSNVRFQNSDKGTTSYAWQCTMAGSIIGQIIIGIMARGPEDAENVKYAFLVAMFVVIPFVIMLILTPNTVFPSDLVSTEINRPMMHETNNNKHSVQRTHHNEGRKPKYSELMLAVLLFATTIIMFVLLFIGDPNVAFTGALIFSVLILLFISIAYEDNEGLRHTCLLGFLNEALHFNISGAIDTWYTSQNDNCVIGGPRFNFLFYITASSTIAGLVGMTVAWLHRRYFIHRYEVRNTLIVALLVWGCASIADISIIRGWNTSLLGIDSWVMFLFGDVVLTPAMSMMVMLPLVALTSMGVEKGVVTLTSMNVISCQNIGTSIGRVFGLFTMHVMNVYATENNGCNYDNLVPLIITTRMVMPLLVIPMCYMFSPNAILEQFYKTT